MYDLLSKYYDRLFKFNPKLKSFLFTYATKNGEALDLGCGTGRLTQVIASLDMEVRGIDLDPFMIHEAKKKYPELSFSTEDMIDFVKQPSETYDLITCFGNTIVHLDEKTLNELFIHVHLVLNKHKYFVVQCLNYFNILKEKPDSLPDLSDNDVLLHRRYTYFKDYIMFQTVLFEDDDVFELGETKLYPYVHTYLMDLGRQHGFDVEVYSKPDFSPYAYDDSHVYLVFKKI
jgi:SAM-dependent methyltransferase